MDCWFSRLLRRTSKKTSDLCVTGIENFVKCNHLYSLSGRASYGKISWSLEAARFGFRLFQSFWILRGTSAATLPRCLSNFRAVVWLQYQISRLRYFTSFGCKMSYRLVNRGPGLEARNALAEFEKDPWKLRALVCGGHGHTYAFPPGEQHCPETFRFVDWTVGSFLSWSDGSKSLPWRYMIAMTFHIISPWNVCRTAYLSWHQRIYDDVIKWKHFPRYWLFVRGILRTMARDAELWCFLWSAPEPTVEETNETLVIWDAIALIMT